MLSAGVTAVEASWVDFCKALMRLRVTGAEDGWKRGGPRLVAAGGHVALDKLRLTHLGEGL